MYLKSIRANGFKSFAEKIELDIKKGITGVVGPNGSGKSNVVDAVKWVLGEQSIKALRGSDKMTDVIFAGSKSRDAQTRAMVSLTFDNTDHYLNSEFNEIEVKRVVYKSGENEYYINNSKVRLKDITELFLDSGAGKESFNIISQGAIADVINSKPEERRSIFEEAAGVLKYRKRKEETVRKLEKTNENLERIDLLIEELKTTVEPLKEQQEVAKKYLEFKEQLEKTEIALIAHDIKAINEGYAQIKLEVEHLNEEILSMDMNSNVGGSKIEQLKLKNIKLDEEIAKINERIIALTDDIAKLNSLKQIATERKKYEVDDIKIQNNIIALKEEELNLKKNIQTTEKEIVDLVKIEEEKEKVKKSILESIETVEKDKNKVNDEYNNKIRESLDIQNKIEILKDTIEKNAKVPYAVRSILNNPRLKGIHNTIGNLIEVKNEYVTAIETALGANANVLVVENEKSAKDAIQYLKENKVGRATFFPMNIIKGRTIDKETQVVVNQLEGFLGLASNLVTFDKQYKNIIENQLGNVMVVKDIDALNEIGKLTEYRYRIVTLEGEIQYSGGSLTGGTSKNNTGTLTDKLELENLERRLPVVQNDLKHLTDALTTLNQKYSEFEPKRNKIQADIIDLNEQINRKTITLEELKKNYDAKIEELAGTENLKENKIDDELASILEQYYAKISEKETQEKDLQTLKNHKSDLNNEIAKLDLEYHKSISEYNKKQTDLKEQEVKLGKLDVKLDNLLFVLNETYNMTYEKAKDTYILDTDDESARLLVNKLKSQMKDLGEVNLGSISEYERVNTRYTFLQNQRTDLEESIQSLLEVIDEMDEIMIQRFTDTFEKIKTEFQSVFKKLFKGGEGILKLTDEENILETGIDIIAQPPGKKLNSIILLSGGEKTLTAIALLFAILSVKPVPFVILDEVEAALDEANVDAFGSYLQSKKDKSQFIIITHKKRTMEYADVLYGITMQESGVSKLVSVELENV